MIGARIFYCNNPDDALWSGWLADSPTLLVTFVRLRVCLAWRLVPEIPLLQLREPFLEP